MPLIVIRAQWQGQGQYALAPEKLDQIFKIFRQASSQTTSQDDFRVGLRLHPKGIEIDTINMRETGDAVEKVTVTLAADICRVLDEDPWYVSVVIVGDQEDIDDSCFVLTRP